MKKLIVFFAMVAIAGGFAFGLAEGEAVQSEEAVLEELLEVTTAYLDQWYGQSDPTAFAGGFAGNGTYFDPWSGGKVEDGAIKKYLMEFMGLVPKLEFEIVNPRVDLYGEVAVFTFGCDAIDPADGAVTPWNVTEVFTRTGDGWERVHANWNYLAAAPVPAG